MADRKRTDVDWEDLRFFAALARHGSLSAAARALKVNHATVSRRIASLEEATGSTLFERRADGYRLSDDGRAILDRTGAMEDAVRAIGDRLASPDGLSGRVRLTTTRSLADVVISSHLAQFHVAHPRIELEVVTDIRLHSLAHRKADIALRLGAPKDSDLQGRRVAVVTYGFYGSAASRTRWERGEVLPLIGYDSDSDFVGEARWLEAQFEDHPVALRADSNVAQANAAASGIGIALLPRYLARGFSALVEIPFGAPMPDRDLWLLTPPGLADIPRIRAVLQALQAIVQAQGFLFAHKQLGETTDEVGDGGPDTAR